MKTAVCLFMLLGAFVALSFAEAEMNDYQKAAKFFNEGQYNEAIAMLQKGLQNDPNQAPVYNLLGMIYLRQGESIQSAIGSFEQAIEIDPNYAEAYFNLASTYAGSGNRPELAAEYFKKTLDADPKYTKAHFGLGWFTLTERQDPLVASEHFKKAIESFPDFAEAYYGLGLAQVQMGKAPMALETVSHLRNLGREDLASNLEVAIRGETLEGKFVDEAGMAPGGGDQGFESATNVLQSSEPIPLNEDFLLLDSDRK